MTNDSMGIVDSKIGTESTFNKVDYARKGLDDPDGVGRIAIYVENGYDIGYDVQPTTGFDRRTRGEKGPLRVVQVYTKENFEGQMFEIDYGNYPTEVFIPSINPHNVFSLTVPPRTTIRLFAGDDFVFGGKGGTSFTNASTDDIMRVKSLPNTISGQIRTVSVISHAVDRTGKLIERTEVGDDSEPDSEEVDSVITTEKGDVIAAGMVVHDTLENFSDNKSKRIAKGDMLFYTVLLIIVLLVAYAVF